MMDSYQISLSQLLNGLVELGAGQDCLVKGLAMDSRGVQSGDLFFACVGADGLSHGLDYMVQVVARGAVAVVYDVRDQSRLDVLLKAGSIGSAVPIMIAIPDFLEKIGVIAARFYRDPSQNQFVIGITGTNGKTSCSHFLAQVLAQGLAGHEGGCGLIGTLGYGVYGRLVQGSHTTPNALQLQAELAAIRDAGVDQVVMEVSSHGLDQRRVSGVAFDAAVLTNLSQDHLDYHGDLKSYAAAKRRLFHVPGLRYAVINHDDAFGRRLAEQLPESLQVLSYGFDQGADIHATARRFDADGFELLLVTPWGDGVLSSRLLGRFNASNLLAVLATLLIMGVPLQQALASLPRVEPVRGRMEHFGGMKGQPLVVVDYAHTPDALQQVLQTLREHCRGQLWCVFGCGGDRDRGKRAQMGSIAEQTADRVIVTDDNPRHEAGAAIIEDILVGIAVPDRVVIERDRGAAIGLAVQSALVGDVVLVAGKGHEEYQLVGDQVLPFSDRQQVIDLLREVA